MTTSTSQPCCRRRSPRSVSPSTSSAKRPRRAAHRRDHRPDAPPWGHPLRAGAHRAPVDLGPLEAQPLQPAWSLTGPSPLADGFQTTGSTGIFDSHCHGWQRWPYPPPVPDEVTEGTIDQLVYEMDSQRRLSKRSSSAPRSSTTRQHRLRQPPLASDTRALPRSGRPRLLVERHLPLAGRALIVCGSLTSVTDWLVSPITWRR